MEKSESISKIAPALLEAQKSMAAPKKKSTNPFFKSKYADLNSVLEACINPLNNNGITVLQPIVQMNDFDYVETILIHTSGEFISGKTKILIKSPNDPQAQGSGISYARRYGLQSLVNLGADDDDGNGANKEKPQTKKVKEATPEQKGIISETREKVLLYLNDPKHEVIKETYLSHYKKSTVETFTDTQIFEIKEAGDY